MIIVKSDEWNDYGMILIGDIFFHTNNSEEPMDVFS